MARWRRRRLGAPPRRRAAPPALARAGASRAPRARWRATVLLLVGGPRRTGRPWPGTHEPAPPGPQRAPLSRAGRCVHPGEAAAGAALQLLRLGRVRAVALYPEYRMFIDGRTHVYGHDVLQDFLEIINLGPRWQSRAGQVAGPDDPHAAAPPRSPSAPRRRAAGGWSSPSARRSSSCATRTPTARCWPASPGCLAAGGWAAAGGLPVRRPGRPAARPWRPGLLPDDGRGRMRSTPSRPGPPAPAGSASWGSSCAP